MIYEILFHDSGKSNQTDSLFFGISVFEQSVNSDWVLPCGL